VTVGLLHPGEMGAAAGAALRARGETVLWVSGERSAATAERARSAGLEDAGGIEEFCRRSEVVISLCPPHAAVEVAGSVRGFTGIYVDANAVSPATARTIAKLVDRCVDGGIIGPPPAERGTTRLYLSGHEAKVVADLFAGTTLEARIVSADIGAASAVKMTFAAWTKGSSAMLLAIRALARAQGVEDTLVEEWRMSLPQLGEESNRAARAALRKGWRWIGEMEEIAETFAASDLPDGFHQAAAEIYRRVPHEDVDDDSLQRVLASLSTKASV
jgi:3-hydroxyisobutyrate dehydrogenase-like beta-hydroxyacid dehydrogenase